MARNIRINKRKEPLPPLHAVIPTPVAETPRINLTALPDAVQESIRSVQEFGRAIRGAPSPPPVIGMDYCTALETHRRMEEAQRRPDREVRMEVQRDIMRRTIMFLLEGPILSARSVRMYAEISDEECIGVSSEGIVDLVMHRMASAVAGALDNEVRTCLTRAATGELAGPAVAQQLASIFDRGRR